MTSSSIAVWKIFWKFLLWANALFILFFWYRGSGSLLGSDVSGALIALGRVTGLVAAYMILLQFVFMSRLPWLERVFGLDNLSRVHQKNGKWAFVFLVLHPLLITLGYASVGGHGFWEQVALFFTDFEHVFLAFIGLLLFVVMISTSIAIARSRLRYEAWYFVHLVAYAAVFLSFLHQREIGEDIIGNYVFYTYWSIIFAAVFVNHLVFRFGRPIWLFFRNDFRVARVVRESPTTVSLYITGRHLDNFSIRPGQFMIFRFFMKGLWWQAHPFSMSMVPNGREIRITVKELGDFTMQLKNVNQGTRVLIDGPHGIFTDLFSMSDKILLIAGGIGITPIRSLMEEMVKKGKDVVLLYGNRTEEEIVFREEIDELRRNFPTAVTHILSHASDFAGEKGIIDEEKVTRLVPDYLSREVFLCGPPPMMNGLIAVFKKLGVPRHMVHYERFAF